MSISIKNDFLTVTFSSKGAEMKSVLDNKTGENYLWSGDSAWWSGTSPVLFPICGGLIDDTYNYNGKEYRLIKHGFARHSEFSVVENLGDSITFSLCSSEETKAVYPFDFEFLITYTLINSSIKVIYTVKNLTDGDMYFSVGSHEAYACDGGIEDYTVEFEKVQDLEYHEVIGNFLAKERTLLAKNTNSFGLKNEYFAVDALPFTNLISRKVSLLHNCSSRKITVEFDGFDYFLIWTKPGAPFVCFEPWAGIPDFLNDKRDFTEKIGINKIEKGGVCEKIHTITFEK